MAEGTKWILTFETNEGKKVQYSYNHAKPATTTAQANALAAAMINNTQIYENTLTAVVSIIIRTTTETDYEVDSTLAARPAEIINGNPEITTTDNQTVKTEEINTQ